MKDGFFPLWQKNGVSWSVDRGDIISLLQEASFGNSWLMPRGTNYTFLVKLSTALAGESLAIYKPRSGEAPLFDFPDGTLYKREHAAFVVSEALGWRLVPPTVIRDGPHGVGSVQLFIESDPTAHYLVFGKRRVEESRKIALFDYLVNNADRKAGHCLEGYDGRVWLIDNGLTFNDAPKLRTVVWDFQGEPVPADALEDLVRFKVGFSGPQGPAAALSSLLSRAEIRALQERLEAIIAQPVFPRPGYYRSVPWPPI